MICYLEVGFADSLTLLLSARVVASQAPNLGERGDAEPTIREFVMGKEGVFERDDKAVRKLRLVSSPVLAWKKSAKWERQRRC
jgi:hypothetical protein